MSDDKTLLPQPDDARSEGVLYERAAIFCVGNRLMLDDGLGTAVYDELIASYDLPKDVVIYDCGCVSLDLLPYLKNCDLALVVDAVKGSGAPIGSIVRFRPEESLSSSPASTSLHDLSLSDLLSVGSMLGYKVHGICLGMEVENPEPDQYEIGLTPKVAEELPRLLEAIVAELASYGFVLTKRLEP